MHCCVRLILHLLLILRLLGLLGDCSGLWSFASRTLRVKAELLIHWLLGLTGLLGWCGLEIVFHLLWWLLWQLLHLLLDWRSSCNIVVRSCCVWSLVCWVALVNSLWKEGVLVEFNLLNIRSVSRKTQFLHFKLFFRKLRRCSYHSILPQQPVDQQFSFNPQSAGGKRPQTAAISKQP